MRRHLLNLATCLSLLLAAAASVMWVRSQSVTEAWCFTPRQYPKARHDAFVGSRGWERWGLVASMDGRFAWAGVYERLYDWTPGRSMAGYYRSGFMPPDWKSDGKGFTARTLRVPGVADWVLVTNPGDNRIVRVVTVSWLVPAFAGAALPAVRLWLYRRRQRSPVFEVLTARGASAGGSASPGV